MNKVKITYRHQVKEGVMLQVVGNLESELTAETVLVRRLDGVLVDIPVGNIIQVDELS